MTPHSLHWRRIVAVAAASLALHYAVLGWRWPPRTRAVAPPTVVASLHGAPAPAPVPAPEASAAPRAAPVQLPGPVKALRPRYRTSLPPAAQLSYDVLRTDADGARHAGQASLDWRHGGGRYQLALHSEAMDTASEGATGRGGLVPRTLTSRRGGKAGTATHFNARQGRITFSASEASVPMAPGTQDKASVLMQLAAIARADSRQLGRAIALPVGADKEAGVLRLELVGQEQIETGMGPLLAWHWSQPVAPGSYRARLDVWLAPGHEWYPVQLRSTEANGAVTTRTIRRIDLIEVDN
ncbi:MAG: DUF3108 domain-containing protein [Pseudomonadota bacterium]